MPYDDTQCDESIQTGDTLIVLAEEVLGIAMAGPFKFAIEAEKRGFIAGFSGIIDNSNFILICDVIDKHRLGAATSSAATPTISPSASDLRQSTSSSSRRTRPPRRPT